jgi:hypothetical protein
MLLFVKCNFTEARVFSGGAIFSQGPKLFTFGGQAREEDLVNFRIKYFGLFFEILLVLSVRTGWFLENGRGPNNLTLRECVQLV